MHDILAGFVQWCDDKSVRYVSTFMEAEWELCKLEIDGVIDAVASNIIQLLDINVNSTDLNCTIISGNRWTDYVNDIIPDATLGEMAYFAVLLGVDYLERPYSNSVSKVKSFFPNWRKEKEDILLQMEKNDQLKGKRSRAGIPGYMNTLRASANIFQYAPCYVIEAAIPGETVRESFWSGSFLLRRGNLRRIPAGHSGIDLFGFNPESILPEDHTLMDLFSIKIWIRTSCSLLDFIVPFPRNDRNEILPWGCHSRISYLSQCSRLRLRSSFWSAEDNPRVLRIPMNSSFLLLREL